MKIKVMHYYTYPENSGGPLSYLKNIIQSPYLQEDVEFSACYQMKPASAVRKADFARIVSQIRTFSPQILHIHGLQSEGFLGILAGRKAKVPKILMTVHGLQMDAQDIGAGKRAIFSYIIEPYELRQADASFCVCERTAQRPFVRKYAKNLLPTVHNFVTDAFLNKPSEFPLPPKDGKTILTYVGRVSTDKGMKELEFCIRQDTAPDTQYWIVGDGNYRGQMEENLAQEVARKKVIFWGQQSQVKPFLEATDLFLFFSHHENLSIALLEAGSQDCCCVVTDVGGNTEVVEDDVNGVVIPAEDCAAAWEAVQTLLRDPHKAQVFGNRLGRKIRTQFGEQYFAQQLLQIYRSLV